MLQRGPLTSGEIARALDVIPQQILRDLIELEHRGEVEGPEVRLTARGPTRRYKGQWRIVEF